MRTVDVVSHFGSKSEVARVLGITRSAVGQWKELVPPLSAARIAKLTRGKLKFDPNEYGDRYDNTRKAS